MSYAQPGPVERPNPITPPDTSPIRRLISKVRTLLRSSWVATGLGVTLALLFGVLVAAAVVDVFLPLPVPLRLLSLVAVVVPSALAFHAGVVRPLFRRLHAPRVARTIEPHLPGIHNRLVSVVDLEQKGAAQRFSPTFHHRLVAETLERIRNFRPSTVVNFQNLRRAAVAACVTVGAFLAAYTILNDRLPTALARIFQPFADIPPVSGIFYEVLPGDAKSLRGDEVVLAALVTRGEPDRLQVEITSRDTGKTLWYDLAHDGQRWSFSLEGFEESFDYRIHGGGTWSRLHHITMIDRPQLVDLGVLLHYPKYMGIPEPRVNPPQQLDVTGPEESTVELVARTAGNVAEGEIVLLQEHQILTPVADRAERVWFAESLPDGAQTEGTWEWDLRLLARSAHSDPPAPGLHRHLFHSAGLSHKLKPAEYLFAHLYVDPQQIPETIMLEWHDGQNWEHRAYWGADKVDFGKSNTASRRHMGPIPTPGEWTRLELPAAVVDLEQKTLRGMAFTLFGGKATWHRSGSLPASHVAETELVIAQRFPLSQLASDQWGGRFPLIGSGFYRVELKNELGYPSQTMREARYLAISDYPPQIVVERPGTDILLSKPVLVPLAISAYDDFGLAKIVLAVQVPGVAGFESRPIRKYETPAQTDDFLHTLDLPAMNLKPGDVVKYRVEAHDRKEQSRSTQEFTIRIQDDAKAADRKLDTFEQQQATLKEKFDKLVAQQAKLQEKIKALKEKSEPLAEKVEQAQAQAQKLADALAASKPPEEKPADLKPGEPQPPAKNPAETPAIQLDPADVQALADLKQQLTDAALQEEQTTAAAQQIAQELKGLAENAANLELLPPQIQQQLQQLPQQMQSEAVRPLQDLTADLKASADPKTAPQELPHVAAEAATDAATVQDKLESLQQKLAALAEATQQARQDAAGSVETLREKMLAQQAKATNKDLENLEQFIENLRRDLQGFEQTEAHLQTATETVPELMLPDVKQRQEELETKADPKLAQVRELLTDPTRIPKSAQEGRNSEKRPDSPYADPRDANPANDPAGGESNPQGLTSDAVPLPKLAPALTPAGKQPPEKNPSRQENKAAKKSQPAIESESTEPGQQKRQELAERQALKLSELEAAEQALGTDLATLQDLIDELRTAAGEPVGQSPNEPGTESAATAPEVASGRTGELQTPPTGEATTADAPQGTPDSGAVPAQSSDGAPPTDPAAKPGVQQPASSPGEGAEPIQQPINAAELAELLNSERVKQAQAMAARLQAAQQARELQKSARKPQNPSEPTSQPTAPGGTISEVAALTPSAADLEVTLKSLDLETRTILLKMQPKLREELLQGLREEGPEGYQKFIRNYYQRLARVKKK